TGGQLHRRQAALARHPRTGPRRPGGPRPPPARLAHLAPGRRPGGPHDGPRRRLRYRLLLPLHRPVAPRPPPPGPRPRCRPAPRPADPTGAVAGFADATGAVAGFADATGRYLPLVCTLNAARVLTAAAALLGVDLDRLAALALSAPAGAGGLVMLPYLDGERTPNLPDATGLLAGLTRAAASPANLARAAVEGMLCGLADGRDALRPAGV